MPAKLTGHDEATRSEKIGTERAETRSLEHARVTIDLFNTGDIAYVMPALRVVFPEFPEHEAGRESAGMLSS